MYIGESEEEFTLADEETLVTFASLGCLQIDCRQAPNCCVSVLSKERTFLILSSVVGPCSSHIGATSEQAILRLSEAVAGREKPPTGWWGV